MNVIFLDFNGILDTYDNFDIVDKNNLMRLKKIVDATDSKVVISSSCKNNYYRNGRIAGVLKYLIETLLKNGIDVIGLLPMGETREEEIEMYLLEHPEVSNFVILDDDYDMPKFKSNLIKLPCQMIGSEQTGLEDCHIEEAIKILDKK